MADHKTIECVIPNLLLHHNVAIIGSSARLLQDPVGEQIDQYNEVVRFNRAPTDGYEEYVGAKTTLRVTNNHVFNNNKLDEKEWSDQPQYFIKNLKNTNILYFARDLAPWWDRKKNADPSCRLHIVNYERLDAIRRGLYLPFKGDFSVGAGFVFLCLASGIKPHLFGFDLEAGCSRSHYWETRPKAGPVHSVSSEKKWLQLLARHGKIIYH
tara:strand:+ start:9078 stop:9710 length:633 start_codon:yes stop_codon:yes gene_type:complete